MGTHMKYELLALLPLNATDPELTATVGKLEERLKAAGATVVGNSFLQKGKLAFPIQNTRQGYYHTIQLEIEPRALAEVRKMFALGKDALRFTITQVKEFKMFVPTPPKVQANRAPRGRAPERPMAARPQGATPVTSPAQPLAQEKIKPEATKKVTMEELDKRLEEILGDK